MHGERVARWLLERGRLADARLGEARRTQAFFGGDLGTHLVQLGHVSENDLGEALSEVTGAPWADPHLRGVDPEVASRLPADLAARHRVFLFGIEGDTARLAMLNPRDAVAIAAVRQATGLEPEPWVASEHRLIAALRRYHRIDVDRVAGLRVDGLDRRRPSVERESPAEVGDRPADPAPEVGLDGLPLDAEIRFDDPALFGAGVPDDRGSAPSSALPPDGPLRPPAAEETARPAEAPAAAIDPLSTLEARLAVADDRDDVAAALLDFCRLHAGRCALFAVGKDGLRCLAGRGRSLNTERLRRIRLPLEGRTVFATALAVDDFYLGPVAPLPENKDVFSLLGGSLPPAVLILPIRVRGRVVALLYLDDDAAPIRTPDVPMMRRIARKAGIAFELLLLRRKLLEI